MLFLHEDESQDFIVIILRYLTFCSDSKLCQYLLFVSECEYFSHFDSCLLGVKYVSVAEHFPLHHLDLWSRDGVNMS